MQSNLPAPRTDVKGFCETAVHRFPSKLSPVE